MWDQFNYKVIFCDFYWFWFNKDLGHLPGQSAHWKTIYKACEITTDILTLPYYVKLIFTKHDKCRLTVHFD